MTDASTTGAVERLTEQLAAMSAQYTGACQQLAKAFEQRDAAIQRAEAAERELHTLTTAGIIEVAIRNLSVMDYMKHWESRAERAESEITQFCAQAALAWEAGRDAAAKVAELYRERWPHAFAPDASHEVKSQYVQMTRAARIIAEQSRDLTPPADLSAALTARLDAEWAKGFERGVYWEFNEPWPLGDPDRIRALRRAAPTEEPK